MSLVLFSSPWGADCILQGGETMWQVCSCCSLNRRTLWRQATTLCPQCIPPTKLKPRLQYLSQPICRPRQQVLRKPPNLRYVLGLRFGVHDKKIDNNWPHKKSTVLGYFYRNFVSCYVVHQSKFYLSWRVDKIVLAFRRFSWLPRCPPKPGRGSNEKLTRRPRS